ncbi:MAG: hypothetical protein K5669_06930 [Lachnospiraceae bacterium]|nr:hypothetical protein [Lachnospiraceae bacterium]
MNVGIVSATENISYSTNVKAASETEKKVLDVAESSAEKAGATYEKSTEGKSSLYSINKMSSEERTALVNQLKADQEARESQFTQLVTKMMTGQAGAAAKAGNMWEFLASGEFTVDPATKAQAQEDISEDGYWGVKQTSQRLFDFASALAGDDEEKMKKMQEAMMKGYEMATGTWGRELPEISKQTIDAANKLFEDYYASKESV